MGFREAVAEWAGRFGELRRGYTEMYERQQILLEPWTHDILHWGADGVLHGSIVSRAWPPVTRSGWCPCRPLDVDPSWHSGGPTSQRNECPQQ